MKALEKVGGVAALCQGLGLASLAVLFFAILPSTGFQLDDFADPTRALPLVTARPFLFFWMTAVVGVLFDALTIVLVLALHNRLQGGSPHLVGVSTAFGFLSLFLFMVAALLNYHAMSELAAIHQSDQTGAASAYLALNAAINALRGGANFAAGLWFLLLSWAALHSGGLPRGLSYFGLLVGAINLLGLFGIEIGMLVNVPWFLALGFVLLRNQSRTVPLSRGETVAV